MCCLTCDLLASAPWKLVGLYGDPFVVAQLDEQPWCLGGGVVSFFATVFMAIVALTYLLSGHGHDLAGG